MQMSLLKHNRRPNQKDSLPRNTATKAGGSEVPQCGPGAKLRYGFWGPPEAEAFCTFAHNSLQFCPMQDLILQTLRRQIWDAGF